MGNVQYSFSWRGVTAAFIIGTFIGGIGTYALYPRQQTTPAAVPSEQVTMQAELTSDKEIAYVEKTPGEKTDVQIDAAKPKVTVSVNGQEKEFQLATTEKQKFDKGKLVITEETQLKLDIKTPQPRFNIGMGWSNHGPALTVAGRISSGPADWWLYGDRRTLAGGIRVPIGK